MHQEEFAMRFRKILSLAVVVASTLAMIYGVNGITRVTPADTPPADIADQVIQGGWGGVREGVVGGGGWVVVGGSREGSGAVGAGYVPAGKSDNISVWIDMDKAARDMSAMLHVDKGTPGKYEFPGADVPVQNGDK